LEPPTDTPLLHGKDYPAVFSPGINDARRTTNGNDGPAKAEYVLPIRRRRRA